MCESVRSAQDQKKWNNMAAYLHEEDRLDDDLSICLPVGIFSPMIASSVIQSRYLTKARRLLP